MYPVDLEHAKSRIAELQRLAESGRAARRAEAAGDRSAAAHWLLRLGLKRSASAA